MLWAVGVGNLLGRFFCCESNTLLQNKKQHLIRNEIDNTDRFHKLRQIFEYQLKILNEKDFIKALKKLTDDTY